MPLQEGCFAAYGTSVRLGPDYHVCGLQTATELEGRIAEAQQQLDKFRELRCLHGLEDAPPALC